MPPEVLVAAGILLLAAGGAWRVAARRKARRLLAAALADPNPAARVAGLSVIGDRGLRPYSDVLVALASRERDPAVLNALAFAVARSMWEPADDPRLMQLRLWAARGAAGRVEPGALPGIWGWPATEPGAGATEPPATEPPLVEPPPVEPPLVKRSADGLETRDPARPAAVGSERGDPAPAARLGAESTDPRLWAAVAEVLGEEVRWLRFTPRDPEATS